MEKAIEADVVYPAAKEKEQTGNGKDESAVSIGVTGLDNAFDNNSNIGRRLIWIILILSGAGFLGFHVFKRVEYYLSWPTAMTVKIEHHDDISWPSFTICNKNQRNMDVQFFQAMQQYNAGIIPRSEFDSKRVYSIEDMLGNWDTTWRQVDYNYTAFVRSILGDTHISICYTFNYVTHNMKPPRPKLPTSDNLFLSLDPKPDAGNSTAVDQPVDLYIHPPSAAPRQFYVHAGLLRLRAGTTNDLYLKRSTNRYLKKPHGQCGVVWLKYYEQYNRANCKMECMLNYTINKWGCKLSYMPSDVLECSSQIYYEAKNDVSEHMEVETGKCLCPYDCEEQIYYTKVSSSGARARTCQQEKYKNKLTKMILRMCRSIELKISYEEMTETVMEQEEAYGIFALFSDIGGAMGLILGSCVLTVAQIIDLSVYYLIKKVCARRR